MSQSPNKCALCGRAFLKSEGKHLSLKPEQIIAIFQHFLNNTPEMTQKAFCKRLGIVPRTYMRITRLRIKQPKDKEKIIAIANALGYDILAAIEKTQAEQDKEG